MPELPEVETIRRQLGQELKGKKINSVKIFYPKAVRPVKVAVFVSGVTRAKIIKVSRRAKLLLIYLSNGNILVTHLKLTGRLLLKPKKERPISSTEIIFNLIGKKNLFFDDLRRFGFMRLVSGQKLADYLKAENFGPEPLAPDFTLKIFKKLLIAKPRAKIKSLLLDQTFIAGVGNIYAQETCFLARVLPTRVVGNLTDLEIKNLYASLKKVLRESIARGGTSTDDYCDVYGQKGDYASRLKVYGRAGELCVRCQTKIKKITLAGRGTSYCPKCQV